ncbi:MAG TPA: DUF1963 domain-containing protein [Myxococcota bacterium]|nr:DUF1963 domain-containing protein [Myxococcota bacterium]
MKPETPQHEAQRKALLQAIDALGLGAHRDTLLGLLKPAIGLQTRAVTDADLAVGATRVGGEPDLPPALAWPSGEDGPLLFVLQVSLAQVAAFRACGVDILPELHLPSPHSELVTLPSDAFDVYWDEVWLPWRGTLRPGPAGTCGIHQLLGYAVAERDEAQGLNDEVLIGFDSDDRAAMEWGDVHCVWAIIDRAELIARNFGALRPEM